MRASVVSKVSVSRGGKAVAATASALIVSLGGKAFAQDTTFADFLSAATDALGGDATTIEFTGNGWDACLGQAWDINDGWARWELTGYSRIIDYAAGTSVQTAMRRAGLDPDKVGGCGGQVDAAATAQRTSIAADAAFAAKLPIWLTPHGLLTLARNNPTGMTDLVDGRRLNIQFVEGPVTFTVSARYGDDYLPLGAETRVDDPIFGDMSVIAEFEDYRSFGDLTFPGFMTLKQGGLATFALNVATAETGLASPEMPPPRRIAGGRAEPEGSFSAIGDGVFVMPGAYQGVAVEFDEFSVVIDGMQSDARTAEIIALTHEAIPDKPIRYAINTHSHFDHASGLRQYAAEGAEILTHAKNAAFFRAALSAPRTLNPNRIEPASVNASIRGLDERFTISDDSGQELEIVPLGPSQHAADMLIAWLPRIRTVVESDLLQPWINPIFAGDGDGPHPYLVYLYNELERAGLDFQQFVPIHTPPEPPTMPRSALLDAVGR
jgi:glyoxylase-like metal-dependent hydrolase (beta-lactamase superfamily II)